MSKLSDAITATVTNRRLPLYNFNIDYIQSPGIYNCPNYDYKVRFTATFGSEVYIGEKLTHDKEYLQKMLQRIKRMVVEEIFGEFREPILDIQVALLCKEYAKAEEKIIKLEEVMFNV